MPGFQQKITKHTIPTPQKNKKKNLKASRKRLKYDRDVEMIQGTQSCCSHYATDFKNKKVDVQFKQKCAS